MRQNQDGTRRGYNMLKVKELIDFRKLPEYKSSDIGYFLGCGETINDITEKQWEIIGDGDVWVSNNFHYHWFVPDFYHVEIKSGMPDWIELWKKRKLEKGSDYDNVKYIVNRDHCDHTLYAIDYHPTVFGYPRKVIKSNNRGKRYKAFANHSNNASFTLVLDLMSRMKYEKTILFGVDLRVSTYFWTDRPEFGETHQNTNKGLAKTDTHSTATRVPRFVEVVKDKWFGGKLFLGYKKSLLIDFSVPYIDIEKELNI
jgi:hypothetical protein